MRNTTFKLFTHSDSPLHALFRSTYDNMLLDVWQAELEGTTDLKLRQHLLTILGNPALDGLPNSLEALDQRILEVLDETLQNNYGKEFRTLLVELLYGPNQNRLAQVTLRRERLAHLFDEQVPCAQS